MMAVSKDKTNLRTYLRMLRVYIAIPIDNLLSHTALTPGARFKLWSAATVANRYVLSASLWSTMHPV